MLTEKLPASTLARSPALLLVIEAVLVALVISLGIVWGAGLLGVGVGAALPAALGAGGAAAFAARRAPGGGDR